MAKVVFDGEENSGVWEIWNVIYHHEFTQEDNEESKDLDQNKQIQNEKVRLVDWLRVRHMIDQKQHKIKCTY